MGSSRKLSRNDPCWCGSGRKYKRCHLNKEATPRLPVEAIAAKVTDSAYYQTCLHPEAAPGVCTKIAAAHTLQRSRVLKSIESTDHHVLSFYPPGVRKDGDLEVHRRGWRKASTFDAFCAKHDSATFAPLEAEPFCGSKQQIFLIAYRAICWELYQKHRALRANPIMRQLLDCEEPVENQQAIQHYLKVQFSGFKKGYEDANRLKAKMDAAYLHKDYSAFEALRIRVNGSLEIAATGAISPNRSLSGVALQTLHDPTAQIEWLPFGVDVEAGGFSVVFLWEKGAAAPKKYLEEILDLSARQLECFLPQFFFAHCENTYFSEAWWNGCNRYAQAFTKKLVANSNPYYSPPPYSLCTRLALWTISTRERS
jgi:hypothetical protein